MKFKQLSLAATLCVAASSVLGQVQVEERGIDRSNSRSDVRSAPSQTAVNVGELYYQLQMLQQEVLELRGLVEEQNYQIKKLKQQKLDDYVDLDRRLGKLELGGVSSGPAASETQSSVVNARTSVGATSAPSTPNVESHLNTDSQADEFKRYKAAYRYATQDPVRAEVELKRFVNDFPESRYAANSLFVLGELKLKEGELEAARSWFERVITEYPTHYRVVNAKLKLGKVFQLLGNSEKAKQYWREVAATDTDEAETAKDSLNTYYPN